MSSDWDMPVRRASDAAPSTRRFRPGSLDPLALAGFVMRNIAKILLLALAFAVIALIVVRLIPFPYSATAVVLVDPREQNVTLQQDVLTPIGSDSAVLESMVQIMRTDGFLLPVLVELGMIDDADSEAGREKRLKALAEFRSKLTAERRGATYLVEITYRGKSPQEAAHVANTVARTFADYHNGARNNANENATRALSERLVELRRNLTRSEQAAAEYQAQNGIIYLEQEGGGTVQKRELAELSAQLAAARNTTEQARARYEEARRNGSEDSFAEVADAQNSQYGFLRQQRAQLSRELAELQTVYGPLYPSIGRVRQAIANLDQQIAAERRLLTEALGKNLEVAEAQQELLTRQMNTLGAGVSISDTHEVELEALRREAAADRAIYESFLNRNKATDELAAIGSVNVTIVSEAIAPLRSTRPSTALLGIAFAGLGTILATAGLIAISPPSQSGQNAPKLRRTMPETGPETRPAPRPARPASLLSRPAPKAPGAPAAPAQAQRDRPPRAPRNQRNTSLLNIG